MPRLFSLLTLVLVILPAPVSAAGATPPEAADSVAQVRAELGDLVRRQVGTRSVRFTYLARLTASGGVLVFRQPRSFDCETTCAVKGLLAQVEAGTGGGTVSLGWGSLVGEKEKNRFFLHHVYVGYALRGSILRTWGDAPLEPVAQTFAGAEAEFAVAVACFSLGVYRRISGAPGEPTWRLTGGIGWGF
jgi:hypothetical protein